MCYLCVLQAEQSLLNSHYLHSENLTNRKKWKYKENKFSLKTFLVFWDMITCGMIVSDISKIAALKFKVWIAIIGLFGLRR
jgi:hypothetical protein